MPQPPVSAHKLFMSKEAYLRVKEDLLKRFPDLANDERALLDTLDGETDFDQMCERLFRYGKESEGMAKGLGLYIDELTERKKRLAARYDGIRAVIQKAMEDVGRIRIEAPSVTLSVVPGKPKVIVTDEEALDFPYRVLRHELVVDKTAISAALEAGEVISGVIHGNGEAYLTGRVK